MDPIPLPIPTYDGLHYLIWSLEHEAWLKGDYCSYTCDRELAGIYTEGMARKMVIFANAFGSINKAMVPCSASGTLRDA